jgi:hypothetical protein
VGQSGTIGHVGPTYDSESGHGSHTVLISLRFRGNDTYRGRAQISRVDDLTKLEKLREAAVIQSAKHQQAMRRYHTHNISSQSFRVRDFVLQKIQTTKDRHKLSPV